MGRADRDVEGHATADTNYYFSGRVSGNSQVSPVRFQTISREGGEWELRDNESYVLAGVPVHQISFDRDEPEVYLGA